MTDWAFLSRLNIVASNFRFWLPPGLLVLPLGSRKITESQNTSPLKFLILVLVPFGLVCAES
jgi:hypothetical protein